jgi:hypothetical protein
MLCLVEYPNIFTFTFNCSHGLQEKEVMLDVAKIKANVAGKQTQLTGRSWQNILWGIWGEYDILTDKSEIRNRWVNCNNGPLKQTKKNWKYSNEIVGGSVHNRARNVPVSGKSVAQLGFSGLYEKLTDGPCCTSRAYCLFLYSY